MRKPLGSTTITLIPSGLSSLRRASDIPSTANLLDRIISGTGKRHAARDGRDVDDMSLFARTHAWEHCLCHKNEAEKVNVD